MASSFRNCSPVLEFPGTVQKRTVGTEAVGCKLDRCQRDRAV